MHNTGKKRNFKKRKKIRLRKFALRAFEIDAHNQTELKAITSIHWTTSVNTDNSSLKEVYIPSLWWLTVFKIDFFVFFFFNFSVELNLFNWSKLEVKLTINPLIPFQASSMPGTFKKFMNYRSRGYQLSLLVMCLFIGRGKHQHNIVHYYFHCFRLE